MLRTVISVLFVLLLAVRCITIPESLADLFNHPASPCDDLFRHVCVDKSGEARIDSFDYLLHDIVKVLHGSRTHAFTRILNAIVRDFHHSFDHKKYCHLKDLDVDESYFRNISMDFEIGRTFGRMIAFGRFDPDSSGDAEHVRVFRTAKGDITKYYVLGKKDAHPFTVQSLELITNEFVKGIFSGYFGEFPALGFGEYGRREVFVYNDLKAEDFQQAILSPRDWYRTEQFARVAMYINEDGLRSEYSRYNSILRGYKFAGYGNVLFAHTLYSHQSELNPSVADEFEVLQRGIKDAIRDRITNATWMSPSDRQNLVQMLQQRNVVIGVDWKHRDLPLLREMLDFYEKEFDKVSPDDECELEMLSRAHGLARHKLLHSSKGSIMRASEQLQYEDSMVDHDIYYSATEIHVPPGFLHIFNKFNMSDGFKYGYVGWKIAQELFRSFGPGEDRWYLEDVMATEKFKNESQCYREFYKERQFCVNEFLCPMREIKYRGGVADVEATRVVFSLLQRTLEARNHRDTVESVEGASEGAVALHSSYTEEQWFFLGQQLLLCDGRSMYDQVRYFDEDDEHPRPQIRLNAVAQQMKGFTKAFGCQRIQRNFVTDKQCALYAPEEPWTGGGDRDEEQATTNAAETNSVTSEAPTTSESATQRASWVIHEIVCIF
uniref:Peptidase_M13 domain-containing protein n=1 Tax=Steinernema glaseri TaxID=37863 RepID=A0A1I7Y339_9BILA